MSVSRSSDVDAVSDAHLTGEWARLLFATLRDAGVVDVWVSPGSRSTPFTFAAQRTEGLTVRAVIDERSAAFMALGHARVTGSPSALLCTSGTAAANYLPAVVEASQAHLPLIVLTADRPWDVQHAHAAQTIDQLKLYGGFARSFFDLGLPDGAQSALLGLRRALSQAVATSRGPLPGPVHLNLRARKPLEPAPARNDAERALSDRVSALARQPLAHHAPTQLVPAAALERAAQLVAQASSGVIVVGPLSAANPSLARPVADLAELTAFPIMAEASSQLRFELAENPLAAPLFDWILSTPSAAELAPELIVSVGATPTSSAYERWAARAKRRIVLAEHGFPDALGNADVVTSGDLRQGLQDLSALLKGAAAKSSAYARHFREAHGVCERRVAQTLTAPSRELSEGAAVKAVVESLPDGAVLALGNSLPIRDVDAYVTRAARVRVVSQRGANGIDGLVSGAVGSALGSAAPTLLLIGDVSVMHDIGALASAARIATPFVVAVVDNAGGRIFDQLPVKKLYGDDEALAQLWLTPPQQDLSRAAALFGLRYVAPSTPLAIQTATAAALQQGGATLLHLRVAPNSAAEMRQAVLAALGAELAETQG